MKLTNPLTTTHWPLLVLSLVAGGIVALWPILGSLALLLIVGVGLLYMYPRVGLGFIVFTVFLDTATVIQDSPMRSLPERYPLVFVPVLLMTLLVAVRAVANPDSINRVKLTGRTGLLVIFVLWACTALAWTLDPTHGVAYAVNLWIGLLIYVLCTMLITKKKHLETLFISLIPWSLVLGSLTFLSNKLEFPEYYRWRFWETFAVQFKVSSSGMRAGGFSQPQLAGTFLLLPIFICCVALFPKAGRLGKLLLGGLGLFLLSCILATGSKGSLGAFILAGFFFLLTYPGFRRWFYVSLPVFMATVLATLISNMILFGADRLARGSEVHSLSISFRLEFWEKGFKLLGERWFGAGLGGFAHLVNPWFGAHSIYFAVLFDLGIVGLALMALYMLCTGIRILETMIIPDLDTDLRRYFYCLTAVLAAVAIHGLVDMQYNLGLIWLVLGLLNAVLAMTPRPESAQWISLFNPMKRTA
jgi:O-antigen ligase